jgi:hypothetical protein
MIVALKFPENEAWLESKEKAVSARTTSGSKTWTMFGSSLSLAPGPAGAGLGRKVSDRSIKDEDELFNNNSNSKDEEDAILRTRSLSALLGPDAAADQLARALGSVAGLGISPALVMAHEGYARKVNGRTARVLSHLRPRPAHADTHATLS